MPNVMIRKSEQGRMTLYVAKKDLEETVVSIEYDRTDKWGGEFKLADGSAFYIEPLNHQPTLPITLRAKRAVEG
jgi:nitrogen fixation protein NifT